MTIYDKIRNSQWAWPTALTAITLISLLLRWYYSSTAMVDHPIRGDSRQYYAYALNLAHHGVFSMSLPNASTVIPDNYRDPAYPMFLAAWMKLFGSADAWYAAVLLSQATIGAFTVTLACLLGRYWLSIRWTIVAGLVMAIWPHNIVINGLVLAETLFGFLCSAGLLLLAGAWRRQSTRLALAAGVALGAAALTNAVLLPFGVLLASLLWWRNRGLHRMCLALALGSVLLPGGWALRNMELHETTQSAIAGSTSTDRALQNFVQGTWMNYHSAWRESIFGSDAEIAAGHAKLDVIEAQYELLRTTPSKGASQIAHRLMEHPVKYLAWYVLEKPRQLWGWNIRIGDGDIYVYPTVYSPFITQPFWRAMESLCHGLNVPLMFLALGSLLTAFSRRNRLPVPDEPSARAAIVMVGFLLAFATLVYSTLQAEPRYSIPFRPFEILLAVTSLAGFATWWSRHRETLDSAVSPAEATLQVLSTTDSAREP